MNTQRRAFIIHGWGGYPEEAWIPWLKEQLEQKGFTVVAPNMPQPDEPRIETWVSKLAELVGDLDENTYLIGHSIGCQTILRYLETQTDKKVGGCVLVAAWFALENLEDKESREIARPWLETPINLDAVKAVSPNITAILSDNDPYNALEYNKGKFQELDAKIIIEHDQGHIGEDSDVTELPAAREAILGAE